VQCLTNLDPNLRQNAAWALAGLKLEPEIAVPVLMARLGTDTNAAVRIGLSAALHAYMWPDSAVNPPRFGRYAHVWYPENDNAGNEQLLKKIELRWYAQQLAAKPHGKGIQPVMSIAYLTTSLTDSDAAIRRQSADALARCPTNARPAVPALVVCLKDTDREVVAAAIEALGNLHLEPDLVVPALTECLKVPEARSRAIFALSQFGKDAQSAVPSLREFLNSDFEDPAKYALEKIAPEPSKRADPPRRAIGLPVRPIREQDYRFP
jgi:HEAT repeat protein